MGLDPLSRMCGRACLHEWAGRLHAMILSAKRNRFDDGLDSRKVLELCGLEASHAPLTTHMIPRCPGVLPAPIDRNFS